MTIREKIEVREAFERGEVIEYERINIHDWTQMIIEEWDFETYNYRIKSKPKQTVVIEKWLCYDNLAESYSICAESNIDGFINDDRAYLSKVKLIDTLEIPL